MMVCFIVLLLYVCSRENRDIPQPPNSQTVIENRWTRVKKSLFHSHLYRIPFTLT